MAPTWGTLEGPNNSEQIDTASIHSEHAVSERKRDRSTEAVSDASPDSLVAVARYTVQPPRSTGLQTTPVLAWGL